MSRNVDLVVEQVLAEEGGVGDVGDGMGITRWGQTTQWLADHLLPIPQTREDAAANYRKWMVATGLDVVCDQNVVVGGLVTDAAVNHGTREGIKLLQRALHVTADGVMGPLTKAALILMDAQAVAISFCAERTRLYGAILQATPSDVQFAHGWLNRLADQIERLNTQ